MIVVLKRGMSPQDLERLKRKIEDLGCTYEVYGDEEPLLRIRSNQHRIARDFILSQPGVQDVFRLTSGHPLANKGHATESTVVAIGDYRLEPDHFLVIAGPCAVESEEQIDEIARALSQVGVRVLRGGAFKPRTSPYSFQGLGESGLRYLRAAADRTGMKIVTEALSSSELPLVSEYTDILQIGSRNMQNFPLLKAAGKQNRPVLLKRGMNATVEEFLLAAEYVLESGNRNVLLCERGIRTFEKATRNTLDINAVPLIKQISHLPILVDPSHASGKRNLILPLSRAALAAGADGIMIEVHNHPDAAKSDGSQSIDFAAFNEVLASVKAFAPLLAKKVM
jgi:3-deoxy-7-phosphoheptulonate synthase